MRNSAGFSGLTAGLTMVAGVAIADGLPVVHELPHALTAQAVLAAVESCAAQGYHVTATVVDKSGLLKAVLHGDGSSPHTLDSARGKAYTAATFAPLVKLDTTTEIAQRFTANGPSPLASLPGMLMAAGGIAIKTGTEVIGAIGVGGAPGGNFDEACAKAGLDKIRGQLGG
jgi:uncharacterized protein GlcG (DUF336 family)